jgi:hypothetical protein
MSKSGAPTIDELQKRLEVVEDERAILQTLYHFCHCADYGLDQEWVDYFTEDGVFGVRAREGLADIPDARVQGREALASFRTRQTRAPAKYHKHLMAEPVITFKSRNEANVVSYLLIVDSGGGRIYVLVFGRYHDRMVKLGGRWRFKERIFEIEALHDTSLLGLTPDDFARKG